MVASLRRDPSAFSSRSRRRACAAGRRSESSWLSTTGMPAGIKAKQMEQHQADSVHVNGTADGGIGQRLSRLSGSMIRLPSGKFQRLPAEMSLKFLSTDRATPSKLDTARSTSGKYEGSRNLRRR